MAYDIQNTATVTAYKYICGNREITGDSEYDTVVNEYVEPSISMVKVASVDGQTTATAADLNETITLTYTVTNECQADIVYTTGIIVDNILTNENIELVQGSETGGTHTDDTITLSLGTGLGKGQSATYTIKLKVTAPDAPVDVLRTHANATLTTGSGLTNQTTCICTMYYQHAELTVAMTNYPTGPVTIGQKLGYEITITNTAKTAGTIAVNEFVDLIPEFTHFDSFLRDGDGVFVYEATPTPRVTNNEAITLAYGAEIIVSFYVIIEEHTNE